MPLQWPLCLIGDWVAGLHLVACPGVNGRYDAIDREAQRLLNDGGNTGVELRAVNNFSPFDGVGTVGDGNGRGHQSWLGLRSAAVLPRRLDGAGGDQEDEG